MKIKIDKADKNFSLWIRNRDGWRCKRCSHLYTPPTSALHCSHFVGRAKENTRFMSENADALCYGCHQYFSSHPSLHYEWQVALKGQDVVDKVKLASSLYKKKDRALEAIYWRKRLLDDYNISVS